MQQSYQHRLHNNISHLVSKLLTQLSAQRSLSNAVECLLVDIALSLELLQKLQSELLRKSEPPKITQTPSTYSTKLDTVSNHSGMQALLKEALRLAKNLTNVQHVSSCAVTSNIILSSGAACDELCSRMLNLLK